MEFVFCVLFTNSQHNKTGARVIRIEIFVPKTYPHIFLATVFSYPELDLPYLPAPIIAKDETELLHGHRETH